MVNVPCMVHMEFIPSFFCDVLAIRIAAFIISARIGLAIADTLAVSWYEVWCHVGRIVLVLNLLFYVDLVFLSYHFMVFFVLRPRFAFNPIRAKYPSMYPTYPILRNKHGVS